jgi:dTDP-4-dehydrorhamnose 3,5-epimerase
MSGFDGKVVRVPKGFGHGFLTLEDNTIMGYLLSSPYNPEMEHAVSAFDPHLGIEWPLMDYVISEKDQSARNITELREAGILPA